MASKGDQRINNNANKWSPSAPSSQESKEKVKKYRDPVHGYISLHPLLDKIIKTMQSQRLRNTKPTGITNFVCRGVSHIRFEHCIHAAHLAGKLARNRAQKQSEVDDKDFLCVEMAGLFHDLGHGPFSYLLDQSIEAKNLWKDMPLHGITETDVTFVKEMIAGTLKENTDPNTWSYRGRGKDKIFLYKIISDIRNGVAGDENELASLNEYKVFCDPVHGHISLHPLLVKIIDTPQFQRLRNIKQVGTTYFVYPGASHNRFEHCIGTAHLAGKLARIIQQKQPELRVDDIDVLCVEMAGLCHDLGHGPFSHVFDDVILRRLKADSTWTHEIGSCKMLDHLIEANNLWEDMQFYGITETDIKFVKKMISPQEVNDTDEWPKEEVGRCESKSFLFEIISNKRNGVDVDKFDYFARDCHHLGIQNSFDHNRFMEFIAVRKAESERLQICARDKECDNLYGMFHMRSGIYRKAGYHTTAKIINCMIADAMVSADEHLKIPGKDGASKKISECVDDPVAYTNLNDGIFDLIVYSTEPKLEEARGILNRVLQRRLYKSIGTIKWSKDGTLVRIIDFNGTKHLVEKECISGIMKNENEIDEKKILSRIKKCSKSRDQKSKVTEVDLVLSIKKFNYGMKTKNPIDRFKFFSKSCPEKLFQIKKEDVSVMLPNVFEEFETIIFCKTEDKVENAKNSFKNWIETVKTSSSSSSDVANQTNGGLAEKFIVFCDSVHGHISLHPVLAKIIDTPQFQRLRHIKQLGFTYFVYPGASHNRFEHSIGTAYLAGQFVRTIKKNQPYLGISDKDVLCVEIAGLCHELGQGPYSRFFDKVFLKSATKNYKQKRDDIFCKMLDHLIKVNELWPVLKQYNIDEDEIEFVKEMIVGPLTKTDSDAQEERAKTSDCKAWLYRERGRDKSFLYEVISNKRSGVDVDKWDYFARDCHHLGIRNTFDHNRFMASVKVLKEPGDRLQICVRDKECENLYGMFRTRSLLHRYAYQHRVTKVIDCMIGEAMRLADPHVTILGEGDVDRKISECVDDPFAYTKLNDGILDHIIHLAAKESEEAETDRAKDLIKARDILDRVFERKLYQRVGSIKSKTSIDITLENIQVIIADKTIKVEDGEGLISNIKNEMANSEETLLSQIVSHDKDLEENLALSVKRIHYGMGSKNPVDEFMFYQKSDTETPFHIKKEDVSVMLPDVFEEWEFLIFCKDDKKVGDAKECLEKWAKEKQPNSSEGDETPVKNEQSREKQGKGAKKQLEYAATQAESSARRELKFDD